MFGKQKQLKTQKESYIGAKKFWAWESRELSDAGFNFLIGYIMFYCTDVIKVDPLLAGSLIAATRIVDGVTDILAGYVVDRTNTKWGRGRPYDVCLLGAWLSIVLLFFCPAGWSQTAKLAWVILFYTLANAVFYTFLNAGEGVFVLRAFTHPQLVKLTSQGNIATSLMGLICGMALPQMIKAAGNDPSAWSRTAIMIAIPLALIGLCRCIFVKEREDIAEETKKEDHKVSFRDIFQMLSRNHYWVLYSAIVLVGYTVSNMGVTVYYFTHVLGNLGLQSIFGGVSALAVFSLFLLPSLMKRFPLQKIILVGCILSAALNGICFIFYRSIPILIVCYVANIFVTLPATYALRLLLFDNAIYNEYLGLPRLEGTMNSVNGFVRRAGTALGAFLLGVGLTIIRYDIENPVMTDGVIMGLRIMMYGIPLIAAAIQAVMWSGYTLEKRMPQIKEELAARNAASIQEG